MTEREHPVGDAETRLDEFIDVFGNEDVYENAVLSALEQTYLLMTILFGEIPAKDGFDAMIETAFPEAQKDLPWRERLEELGQTLLFESRGGELIHSLTAYADYGIVLDPNDSLDLREASLREELELAEELLARLPVEDWALEAEGMVRVTRKALARWKVDCGQPIDGKELALLSGRALQTVKNKLSGKSPEIQGNLQKIEARDALNWLLLQDTYHSSIWRDQEHVDVPLPDELQLKHVMFVPVAKDGSMFHPGLKRDGHYIIGGGGSEKHFTVFNDALAALHMMFWPEWRRPSEGGRWTKVRGVDWRRVTPEDLERLAK